MKRKAIYPGSFDPVTNGHLDVILRASKLFDELIVAVAQNDQKHPLFTTEERIRLLNECIPSTGTITVTSFSGLLVDFAREQGAAAVVRGLRAVSDFEFEFQMALMNRRLNDELEAIFLMPSQDYTFISSRLIKELARLGGNLSPFVPDCVHKALVQRFINS